MNNKPETGGREGQDGDGGGGGGGGGGAPATTIVARVGELTSEEPLRLAEERVSATTTATATGGGGDGDGGISATKSCEGRCAT